MRQASTERRIFLGLILAALAFSGEPAFAQGQLEIRVSDLQIQAFPKISVFLSVFDGSGRRVPGLPTAAFTVLEDEAEVVPEQVEETLVGTRQVFILDTSEAMGLRDSHGRTRFDFVRAALLDWWRAPAASLYGADDLSLLTTGDVLVSHSHSAAELAAALASYVPEFTSTPPDLDPFLHSLTLLSDPAPQAGMPSNVIFFTPGMSTVAPTALENSLARARQAQAAVHVVLVARGESANPDPLLLLAQETGGSRIEFNPETGLRGLADRVLGQRTQYRLVYSSRLQVSGEHRISVRVSADERQAVSSATTFSARVLPPSVTFVQPPSRILRTSDDPTLPIEDLPPTERTLEVLVTFPDEHPRPITQSQLLVDGDIAVQRTEPPFDRFEWDLSNLQRSGQHTIQAVVWDSLGLQGASEPLPVQLQVQPAPGGLTALRRAFVPLAAAFGLLIVGAGLATRILALGSAARSTSAPDRPSAARGARGRRVGSRRSIPQEPEAWLTAENGIDIGVEAFPLAGLDVILGRDPSFASLVLDDPSVSGLHASLIRQADGEYLIRDQGSVAGTWVNFDPVPEAGRRLEQGDLIQVGRVDLRFRLARPRPPRKIHVETIDAPAVSAAPEQEPHS